MPKPAIRLTLLAALLAAAPALALQEPASAPHAAAPPAATTTAPSGAARQVGADARQSDAASGQGGDAQSLLNAGKAAEAIVLLRGELEQARRQQGEDSPETLRCMNNLAYALSRNQEFDEALSVGRAALELACKSGDPSPGTAMVRRNLGEIAQRAGRLHEARELTEAAVHDFEATYGKTPMAAEARLKAAQIAAAEGDLAAAQEHLEWAVAIREQVLGPTSLETASAVQALAGLLSARGQLDASLLLLAHAMGVFQAAGEAGVEGWTTCLVQHLEGLQALGDCAAAKEDMDRWVEAQAAGAQGPAALLNLEWARRYLELGFPTEALERLDALAADAPASELAPLQRGAQSDLRAQAQAMLGLHAEAEAEATAALAQLETALGGRDNEIIVGLLLRRGMSRLSLGKLDEASADLHEALELRRSGLGASHPNLIENFLDFLSAELRRDKVTPELVDLVEMAEAPYANAAPASLAWRRNSAWACDLQAEDAPLAQSWLRLALARKGSLPAAFTALDAQRQRALLAAQAWWIESGAAASEPELRAWLEELHREQATLAPSEARAGERDGLRQALRASGSRWAALAAPEGAALDAARALLSTDDQALLLYFWSGDHVFGLVLRQDAARDRLVDLGACKTLEPKLQAAQAALRDLDHPCDLMAVSAALVQPLWEALAGCHDVTVVADGPLAFVPFEALTVPDGGYWVRNCRIHYAPSVAALLALPAVSAAGAAGADSAGALHVGPAAEHPKAVPVEQIQRLRARWSVVHADGPAPAVAEVLPEGESELSGAAARESTLKRMDADGSLRRLRLLDVRAPLFVDAAVPAATGVLLSPEPADDGLAVWQRENGVLDLAELAGLHLDAALVLLGRGETGPQADAEGLRSEGLHALVRDLWVSGARGVILSGWTLPGIPARNFDSLLLEQARQADAGAALWNAQRTWLERAQDNKSLNLAHPGLWARYRYFGR